MLAIVGLPIPGDQASFLSLTSIQATGPGPNVLEISLAEDVKGGVPYVVATISDGVSTNEYWNFGDVISFVGTADSNGSIENSLTVTTPYNVDVEGFGGGASLSQVNWQVSADFAASPNALPDVQLDLFNLDRLEVRAGSLGGTQASLRGAFASPTLNPQFSGDGAEIVVLSATGIKVPSGVPVSAYSLDIESTNGPLQIEDDVTAIGDVSLRAIGNAVTIADAGAFPDVRSRAGDVTIKSDTGPVVIEATIASATGAVDVKAGQVLAVEVGSSLEAAPTYDGTKGIVSLAGDGGLAIDPTVGISAGRVEITSNAGSNVQLNNLSITSVRIDAGGDVSLVNSKVLEVSDTDPSNAAVAIRGRDVSVIAIPGIRVLDGIEASGSLELSTKDANGIANAFVEFVTTSGADDPSSGAPFGGTLRDMIGYVNRNLASPQPMSLRFSETGAPIDPTTGVPGTGVVVLQADLPAVARSVTFDGLLPDGSNVGIDGNNAALNGFVLSVDAEQSVVQNALFHGFLGAAVRIESAANRISGLILGETRDGTVSANAVGLQFAGPSAVRNVVGVERVGVDAGNIIRHSTMAGILVGPRANHNTIVGNTIEENGDGILIEQALGTEIGSSNPLLGNRIADNQFAGIRAANVMARTTVYGSRTLGNVLVGNGEAAVLVAGGLRNVIGGVGLGEGNTMVGNASGVILRSKNGRPTQYNEVAGNSISSVSGHGVLIEEGFANSVRENLLDNSKVPPSGTVGIEVRDSRVAGLLRPNQVLLNEVTGFGAQAEPLSGGIVVRDSSRQIIGGLAPASLGNIVSENFGSGIAVVGGTGVNGAEANLVEGNRVSENEVDGIRLQGTVGNLVRGNDASRNVGVGISVRDALGSAASDANVLETNTVFSNAAGILVSGGRHTLIGGVRPALGNWVFANVGDGITIQDSGSSGAALTTVLRNNRVGIDTSDTAAGNGGVGMRLVRSEGTLVDQGNVVVNNAAAGIRVEGGSRTVIGALRRAEGNIVSRNLGSGIEIVNPVQPSLRTQAVTVAGNEIRSNAGFGVLVDGSRVSGVTIGRSPNVYETEAGENTITGNVLGGLSVDAAQFVAAVGNSITGNIGPDQSLANANRGVEPPRLTSVAVRVASGSVPQYDVRGEISRLSQVPGTQTGFIDFYGTDSATGRRYHLGRTVVVIRGAAASGSFRMFLSGPLAPFDQIAATVTIGGNTSLLSEGVDV